MFVFKSVLNNLPGAWSPKGKAFAQIIRTQALILITALQVSPNMLTGRLYFSVNPVKNPKTALY